MDSKQKDTRDTRKRNKSTITPQQLVELGKLPPQAVEIETAVLGSLMMNQEALTNTIDILKPEIFYKEAHKIIFGAIERLFQKSEPADIYTICQELKRTGELEIAGGAHYVTSLTNQIGSSANIQFHARIVIEKFIQRELIRISTDTLQLAYEDTSDVFELLAHAEENIFSISNATIKKTFEHIKSILSRSLNEIENAKNQKFNGVPSGFTTLDAITGGWHKSDLIVLAARPGNGKTSLCVTAARNAAVLWNKPVAIFSLEMASTQLVNRLIASESEISSDKLSRGEIDDSKWQHIHKNIAKLAESPIYIDDTPGISVFDFRAKAKRMVSQYGVELIIVDYLQLMTTGSTNKYTNGEQEVGLISKTLKMIAKELDVPIIALSQMSRAVEQRGGDKRPQLSDLRGSGCLHADTLIQCPNLKKTFRIIDLVGRNNFSIFANHSKKTKIMKAKKCFKTSIKEVFEMQLLNGQKIGATSNHKFLTPDGWVELKDLGDNKVAFPINYGDHKNDKINSDEVSIVGHFLANGSALKGQPIRYTCNILDDDLSENVMQSAIQATNKKVVPYYKDYHEKKSTFRVIYFKPTFHMTHGKGNPIADIMRKYGLWDKRTKDKFIPDEFFYLSHKNTCILLKSLFSGDGSAYYREQRGRKSLHISYSSSSEKLILGVQQLLAKVGIVSSVIGLENKKNQKWFDLSIKGKSNIELYVKKIGFWNKRKNDIMINGWERSKNNLAGWTKSEFNENRTICFMPIKSIKSIGIHDVYDIEVPISHNFVANNFIVHNSIEQDADIVMFIYRPFISGVTQDENGMSTEGMAEIIIEKHRNGKTGSVNLAFIEHLAKFADLGANGHSSMGSQPTTNPPTSSYVKPSEQEEFADVMPVEKIEPNRDFLNQGPNNSIDNIDPAVGF